MGGRGRFNPADYDELCAYRNVYLEFEEQKLLIAFQDKSIIYDIERQEISTVLEQGDKFYIPDEWVK